MVFLLFHRLSSFLFAALFDRAARLLHNIRTTLLVLIVVAVQVLCLGQAEGRSAMTPERIAINLDNARIADNAGNQPLEQKIYADGPDGHFSTLPIEKMVASMKAAGIPASISPSAGTFVCNHIFYVMQNYLKDSSVVSGFMHVPLMDEQRREFPTLPTMPIRQMIAGVQISLDLLRV